MGKTEELNDGEPLEIRVVRRGTVVQSGGERSYGFILLLLAAAGVFIYMKWFNKPGDVKKSEVSQPSAEIAPGKPPTPSGHPVQYDIPIPSETEGK